jgi:hypothetical protein
MRSNESARRVLNAMALPSEVRSRNRKTSATLPRATFGFSGSSSKSGRACTARATAAETGRIRNCFRREAFQGRECCASLCWKARIPRQHLTYFVQSPPPFAPRAQLLMQMAEGRTGDPEAGPVPRRSKCRRKASRSASITGSHRACNRGNPRTWFHQFYQNGGGILVLAGTNVRRPGVAPGSSPAQTRVCPFPRARR